jgi:predicted nucleic acid-binding protein
VLRTSLEDYFFVRRFRALRQRMMATAQAQGIFTDEDVFDRVPATPEHPACRRPDEDVVLGTALAGRCDAIVTVDRDLLDPVTHGTITIVSPRGFCSFEGRRSRG